MACQARYTIILIVFLTTYINFAVRANFSISLTAMAQPKPSFIPECKKEEYLASNKTKTDEDTGTKFAWDEHTQGLLMGGFFMGFVASNLVAGAVTEWFGPFKTIFFSTVILTIFNTLCVGCAYIHWMALMAARVIMGLAGGLQYPSLQCLIGKWAPPQERGLFVSALMGNTIGTTFTWCVVGWITSVFKWPWGFYAITVQLVIFMVICFIFLYDTPESHKWISEEELEYIKTSQEGKVSSGKKKLAPYLKILTSLPFWALAVLQYGNFYGMNLQVTAIPKFMKEFIGYNVKHSGFLSSLPHLLRFFLGIGYGVLGDYLKRKKYKRVYILKSFILLSHIIPGILIGSVGLAKCNSKVALTLLVMSMAINGACVMTNLSNPTDLTPNFAGTVFGIVSFIGGTTGFTVPLSTGAIIDRYGNNVTAWSAVFVLGGILYCGCGIVFIFLGSADVQPWNEIPPEPEAEEQA